MTDSLWVVVDPDNGVPPWRQIRDQLVHLIRSRALPPGSPFPPIRQLARDLGLAAGTVARVYRDLETSGLLVTAGRRGTVVADHPPAAPPAEPPTPQATAPVTGAALAARAADPATGAAPTAAPAVVAPSATGPLPDVPPPGTPSAALAEAAARFVAEVRALNADRTAAEAAVRAAWAD
ncbi:GntR family transcriptional regulator [Actinosynnema sp. NPDC050436]|uniref:GntR family transcriptional regulator n=1 Tax=Actinosynnema sp. NPDC050436 TaxID=3155659 RepID=UPI0033D3568B